jgi:hypothetical protein
VVAASSLCVSELLLRGHERRVGHCGPCAMPLAAPPRPNKHPRWAWRQGFTHTRDVQHTLHHTHVASWAPAPHPAHRTHLAWLVALQAAILAAGPLCLIRSPHVLAYPILCRGSNRLMHPASSQHTLETSSALDKGGSCTTLPCLLLLHRGPR